MCLIHKEVTRQYLRIRMVKVGFMYDTETFKTLYIALFLKTPYIITKTIIARDKYVKRTYSDRDRT